ncbi:ABC transporter permease [Haloimpatiens sp. FM7315]|uniref:ABC transporter permease n=1 Tax=Haloimpatiens sp. FM7315 TaxID=3298609 RepID=UPI00370C961F
MRFRNNNKAVIKKLSKNSIKANKSRNIFTIIAIAITTVLFTSLFTIGMGMKNSFEQQTMRQVGGYAHGTYKYLTMDQVNKLKKHTSIKEYGYSIMVNSAENKELLKHYTEIRYATDSQAKMFYSSPTHGTMPEKENEIATDTAVLDLLKVKHNIGEKIKVQYFIDDNKISKEFVLSGFWENDKVMPASMMFVSRKYIDKNIGDRINKPHKSGDYVGTLNLDVMFNNSKNISQKMNKVITESGFSPNSIGYGVNWAYLSTNESKDPSVLFGLIGILLLIIFTGYLIIYNIFQISVIKDIRFYGLLKTIGTTSKQIKKLIKNQALILSSIGIPIGLSLGYIIGNILLPVIIKTTTVETSYISFNPIIFICSAVFSIVTVMISCRKPGKIAAKVSPIEASKYVDADIKIKKKRKSQRGGKIYNMARYNMFRSRKKTILTVISISLSLIILNSVVTFVKGFSMDKYIEREVACDFIAAHGNYFNVSKGFNSEDDVISEEMIDNINKCDGIKGAGRIYYKPSSCTINNEKNNLQLYGMDDFPLSKLKVVEGKIDLKKFKTGKYVIETLQSDDNGRVKTEDSPCKVGDKVTIKSDNSEAKEYTIMAKAELKYNMSVRYSLSNERKSAKSKNLLMAVQLCLPSSEFKNIVKKPMTMSYVFDADDKYTEKTEKFLNNYTEKIEPEMNYDSKKKYEDEFEKFEKMFILVGGVVSLIIGVIGILNFINSILTSIMSRRREFAMLQSIGMTNKQLCSMLIFEGAFYAVSSTIVSIVFGSVISLTIIKTIGKNLWFFCYKFILTPILTVTPILLLISISVPFVIYINVNKQTIVERLRTTE